MQQIKNYFRRGLISNLQSFFNSALFYQTCLIFFYFRTNLKLVRWQYSGTEHDTVMGVGVVNCVYYNPEIDRYWVIDARIYQPDEDGKKKYEHLQDMMLKAIERRVILKTVLMDTWYAITRIMQWINELGYKFACPIRSNR